MERTAEMERLKLEVREQHGRETRDKWEDKNRGYL